MKTEMEGPSVVLPVWEERARHGVALGGRRTWPRGVWFLRCVHFFFRVLSVDGVRGWGG